MEIQNINSLIHAFETGVNLFLGAGFSTKAHDYCGRELPLATALLEELQLKFNKKINDLPKLCTILNTSHKAELKEYLTNRYKVLSYEKWYENINLLNIKGIYTTNIDDLVPTIVAKSNSTRYINDMSVNGESMDTNRINYLPLHGSVLHPERPYIFDVASLANIYRQVPRMWNYLSNATEKFPTVFIGYSFNDSSVIQALTSQPSFENAKQEKWILLRNPSDDELEYFKAMDFSIIKGDTEEFLKNISILLSSSSIEKQKNDVNHIEKLLGKNIVPKDGRNLPSRPIVRFFRGEPPMWNDIIGNNIYKLSYYKDIQDSVYEKGKNTLIIGAPVTGKTTLGMQIAYNIKFDGIKLIFNDLTISRAQYVAKILNSAKALIFIENFTDDIEAVLYLSQIPSVKIVGIDRSSYFSAVSHKFDQELFRIVSISELTDLDFQKVFESLPAEVKSGEVRKERSSKYIQDSIYEFVIRNIKGQRIEARYNTVMKDLEKDYPSEAEFLVLCAYMHQSRVPLSMEVAISYFSGEYDYREVYKIKNQLQDSLVEFSSDELLDDNIDYYYPRSYYTAESILKGASIRLVKMVMQKVIDNVPTIQIFNYKTFRRYAFDKTLVQRAFIDWKEGKNFYEQAFLYDNNNPYILQQGALYLASKDKYKEAFNWIDRAITMTNDKYFSIRNSHAIILFDANYDALPSNKAEEQLDESMEILHRCYNNDNRKIFHAVVYAKQAIRYFNKVNEEKTINYLRQAKDWITEELKHNHWSYELKDIKRELDNYTF